MIDNSNLQRFIATSILVSAVLIACTTDPCKKLDDQASRKHQTLSDCAGAEADWAEAVCLAEHSKNDPQLLTSLMQLGRFYSSLGLYNEAAPLFKHALAVCEKRTTNDNNQLLLQILCDLGDCYYYCKHYSEAKPLYLKANGVLKLLEHNTVDFHWRYLINERLASIARNCGDYGVAQSLYQQAYEDAVLYQPKFLSLSEPSWEVKGNYLCNMSLLYEIQGNRAAAQAWYKLLFRRYLLMFQATQSNWDEIAALDAEIRSFHSPQPNHAVVKVPLFQFAMNLYEDPDASLITTPLVDLALVYMEVGEYDAAEQLLTKCLAIQDRVIKEEHARGNKISEPLNESCAHKIETLDFYKKLMGLKGFKDKAFQAHKNIRQVKNYFRLNS